jgi:hypothetical protein
LDIGLKASKEILDALKYIRERILAARNVFGCLRERDVRVVEGMETRRFSLREEHPCQ